MALVPKTTQEKVNPAGILCLIEVRLPKTGTAKKMSSVQNSKILCFIMVTGKVLLGFTLCKTSRYTENGTPADKIPRDE